MEAIYNGFLLFVTVVGMIAVVAIIGVALDKIRKGEW